MAALAAVELVVRAVRATRVLRGFHERPAQAGRALLGQMASAGLLGGVADDRIEASGADDLACAAKPFGVAELRENRAREDRADPVDLLQRP